MKFSFYLKLAATNIQKNKKNYLPYILSNVAVICVFFTLCSLVLNIRLYYQNDGFRTLSTILGFGIYIVGIFSVIFLFYTSSFLFKRRRKELGLYNVLGMEKQHLAIVNGFETILISVFSLLAGFVTGILFYKFFELLLFKILNQPVVEGFHFSIEAFQMTTILFSTIFALTFLHNLWQIRSVSAISLMSGAKSGEKEPKARWLLTLIGFGLLGGGYYLAQTVPAQVDAILIFFPAVVLVMLGTYLLFISGSVTILKLLKKKKKFYYHPRRFTTISQMIYRMKQNAVGLANISILSTMVIVTLSTTTSLYVGMDDMVRKMYPRDLIFHQYLEPGTEKTEAFDALVRELAAEHDIEISDVYQQAYIRDFVDRIDDHFTLYILGDDSDGEVAHMYFIAQKYVPEVTENLKEDEIVLYAVHGAEFSDTLTIGDQSFKIVEQLDKYEGDGRAQAMMMESYFVIVKDMSVIENIYQSSGADLSSCLFQYEYGFNIAQEDESYFENLVSQTLENQKDYLNMTDFYVEGYRSNLNDVSQLYGGLFFIGLFLGAVFIIATVLIIYYKQISEGYDDAERFSIMQKVGMSQEEIKRTIRSQILGVFFLPLVVACLHMIFAFRLIEIILSFMQLSNTGLFMICCVGVVGIFTLFYALVFVMTSREYYKIVR